MQKNLGTIFTAACIGMGLTGAAVAQSASPAAATKPSAVTYAGVSHPEQVAVTTSAEGVTQPIVFEPYVPLHPTLQARTTSTATSLPDPDGSIVTAAGDQDTWGSVTVPVRSSETDPDEGFVTRVAGPQNQLPVGTMLKVVLKRALTTKSTQTGTAFTAMLAESIRRDDRIVIPAGSIVAGKITEVHGGARLSGAASMHLEPTEVTLPDGTTYRIHAQLIDTGLYRSTKVDREGTLERRAHPKETIAVLALTTGSGAAAGAVFGGAPGALIGGAIGAGVSTVIWLKEDRQAELPVGTKLVFALSAPVTVGAR